MAGWFAIRHEWVNILSNRLYDTNDRIYTGIWLPYTWFNSLLYLVLLCWIHFSTDEPHSLQLSSFHKQPWRTKVQRSIFLSCRKLKQTFILLIISNQHNRVRHNQWNPNSVYCKCILSKRKLRCQSIFLDNQIQSNIFIKIPVTPPSFGIN